MLKRLLFAALLLAGTFWVTADALFGISGNGVRDVTVPDFCGRDAATVDFGEDFEMTVEYRYDEKIPAGVVLRQDPAAGSVRRVNRSHPKCAVKLYVSMGREP